MRVQYPAELDSAVYYCCLEAIQNATKHEGPAVRISVALHEDADGLSFEVSDDGPGFDPSTAHGGLGVQNMRDRLGALDGRLSIVTSNSGGTTVSGSIPLRAGENSSGSRNDGELAEATRERTPRPPDDPGACAVQARRKSTGLDAHLVIPRYGDVVVLAEPGTRRPLFGRCCAQPIPRAAASCLPAAGHWRDDQRPHEENATRLDSHPQRRRRAWRNCDQTDQESRSAVTEPHLA